MASRFSVKFDNFVKSFEGLSLTPVEKMTEIEKKAMVYDFGGCEEQAWKLCKYYLEKVEGYDNLGGASKRIYSSMAQIGVISEEQCQALQSAVDKRNVLFHDYNYNLLDENCKTIQSLYGVFNELKKVFEEIAREYADILEKDQIDI